MGSAFELASNDTAVNTVFDQTAASQCFLRRFHEHLAGEMLGSENLARAERCAIRMAGDTCILVSLLSRKR
jgi:hypothetical protein